MSGALTVRRADLSRAVPPRWAWQDRIVLGYLNLLIGDEGIGKGTLTSWLLARLTRGDLPGDLRHRPVNVAIVGDEDGFYGVWTPRLHAAGADLGRVTQIERPDVGYIDLRRDRADLAATIAEEQIGLVFFDQLLDNLGVGVDDWRQKPVRDALQPLRTLARELDVAALCSLHPNKRADSFRQLVAGAAAFNALSRSSLLLAVHPEDEAKRVLVRGKGNLSKTPAAVEFEMTEQRFDANGHTFKVPAVANLTAGTLSVEDLVGASGATEEHSKITDACEVIEALLPRDSEWHHAKPIYDACAADDIDERVVRRAKARLPIEHRREDKFPAAMLWRWNSTGDTPPLASTVSAVSAVSAVEKPNRTTTPDTLDTPDTRSTRPECGLSDIDGIEDLDAELERLVAKFPEVDA